MGVAQFAAGQRIRAQDINQLPVVVSYLSTGSGGASSVAEVSIGSFTIPEGDPTFPGGYWCYVHGVVAESGSPTLFIRTRLNSLSGTVLSQSSGASVTAGGGCDILLWLMFEAVGSSGTFGNFSQTNVPGQAVAAWGTEATAINTTGSSNTLVVTAQFGSSNASNLVTTKGGALYRL